MKTSIIATFLAVSCSPAMADPITAAFQEVEKESREVQLELSGVAALTALNFSSSEGLQASAGFAFTPRQGIPAGAVGFGYRKGNALFTSGVAFTESGPSVITFGINFSF